MKKAFLLFVLVASLVCKENLLIAQANMPGGTTRDTVRAGVYITSIHNIDFREKEYTIDLWLWLRYQNHALDFYQNLEVPQAKTVVKSFATIDSSDGQIYLLMKLQCVMNDSWRINNFPFDSQALRFSIENSQFENKVMVFVVDTLGKQFDPRVAISGWSISKLAVTADTRVYESAFGDKHIHRTHTEYSTFRVEVNIGRDAMGLFWKMFLGMYIAFFTAFMCFYIHIDNSDSRFNLSVGSLFAAVGNKYIVEASLPESVSFTLVDMLHGITLVFILAIIVCNVISLHLYKKDKAEISIRFNKIAAQILLLSYVLIQLFFIMQAVKGA